MSLDFCIYRLAHLTQRLLCTLQLCVYFGTTGVPMEKYPPILDYYVLATAAALHEHLF